MPHGSGDTRPKDEELENAALIEVRTVGVFLLLGLEVGVDADKISAASSLWGARMSIEASTAGVDKKCLEN